MGCHRERAKGERGDPAKPTGLLRRLAPRNDSKQHHQVILASRSPARRRLLKNIGLKFTVAFADIDELRRLKEPIERYVLRMAVAKAKKIAAYEGGRARGAIIIGADTVISIDSHIFGKPKNKKEAEKFLKKLSGKWHKVYSAVAIVDTCSGKTAKKLVVSGVKFAKLSHSVIKWYIKTGEPFRAAGAYSIQGKGRRLVKEVDGCFENVVGISTPVIIDMLKRFHSL